VIIKSVETRGKPRKTEDKLPFEAPSISLKRDEDIVRAIRNNRLTCAFSAYLASDKKLEKIGFKN